MFEQVQPVSRELVLVPELEELEPVLDHLVAVDFDFDRPIKSPPQILGINKY